MVYGWFMVFNATFNNISVISWRSVLLVEETGGPRENKSQVTDKLYHKILYQVHLTWARFELTMLVIGADCTGNCKSNCHTIGTKTAPECNRNWRDIYYLSISRIKHKRIKTIIVNTRFTFFNIIDHNTLVFVIVFNNRINYDTV
jgi:hypothetical protein